MPYCDNCGSAVGDQALACGNCGAATRAAPMHRLPAPAQTDGAAVASLVLGIVAVVLVWTWIVGLVCGILAVVFGIQARDRTRADPSIGGAGIAKAGFVLGWVALGLLAVLVVLVMVSFAINDDVAFGI